MNVDRRTLIAGTTAGVGLAVSGAVPTLASAAPARPVEAMNRPFPPLVDDPRQLLALPPGFRYQVVTYAGRTKLDDGQGLTPSNHDGTAVFDAPRNRLNLIQNHSCPPGRRSACPTSTAPSTTPAPRWVGAAP